MWLAWKCAVLVFNWSRHIWVLESLQSLCICLFWLFFVSDKRILNLSAHQPKALGWTWRRIWMWGTPARAVMWPFAGPSSLDRCEVGVRSKLRDVLWCTWVSSYFTASWMLTLQRTVHLRAIFFFYKKETLLEELRDTLYGMSSSITRHLPGEKLLSFQLDAQHFGLATILVTIFSK